MRVEILGSGGAITIPRPLCNCNVCNEARIKGIPYSRMGPSIFIHDIGLLIDTPEDIVHQLNRSNITAVKYCAYSHWHPDHTMGRRVFEMNYDWRNFPPNNMHTELLIPEGVKPGLEEQLGTMKHFDYFEYLGIINRTILKDNFKFVIDNFTIQAIRLSEEYVYGYLISNLTTRILIIMDELVGWKVPKNLGKLDLAIVPAGVFKNNPLTGEQNISENHPALKSECTFLETIDIVKNIKADKIVLSHIEEPDRLSYNDLLRVEEIYKKKGIDVEFAYDRMIVEV
ncbi:MBL fold metallo-hydrolase [Vallitalea sp.]|uniref:MBL fold metallo-hydrolase n=1 Tax=Vallitalea sp. TaxID=1882829 RepID=UPI0025D72AD7|nr:MBL fold metallo-hydrolase [Vallitalea sp.]MCT4687013.1 MBL fold metallo-hydrolase [Vallitalea sp.]